MWTDARTDARTDAGSSICIVSSPDYRGLEYDLPDSLHSTAEMSDDCVSMFASLVRSRD